MQFHVDYLQCSLFGTSAAAIMEILDPLLEATGCGRVWADVGSRSHWSEVWLPSGVESVSVCVPKHADEPYVHLRLTGEACTLAGRALVDLFYALELKMRAGVIRRVTVARIDLTWDDVGFTVEDFDSWLRAGVFVSSLKEVTWNHIRNGDQSEGLYLPEMTKSGSYKLRIYDRRGPVRVELQLRDAVAASAFLDLRTAKEAQWSDLAMGYVLRLIDFRPASERADGGHFLIVRRNGLPLFATQAGQPFMRSMGHWSRTIRGKSSAPWFNIIGDVWELPYPLSGESLSLSG